MQSVFGIAKGVNGRRAASAYHLLPGASNGNNPAAAGESQPQPLAYATSPFDGVPLPLRKPSPTPTLASSFSSSSLATLSGLDATSTTGSSSAATDLVRLHSSPFINVKPSDAELDVHATTRHGSAVDKTNPFIGYFQTGRDSTSTTASPLQQQQSPPPTTVAKPGLPPRSASTATLVTTPYAALLSQPKRVADWLGTQSARLPSLFTRRETSASARRTLKQQSLPSSSSTASHGDSDSLKSSSLLSSLKAAASSLGALSRQNSEQQQSRDGRTLAPISALTLKAATSRFETDFEVLGSLGQGGQGAVFKARSRVDNCVYAIKQVELSSAALDDVAELEQARREAVAMAAIPPHPNVVRYHTAWIEVAPVESGSSSTASVRGSAIPSDVGMSAPSQHGNGSDSDDSSFSLDLSCASAVAPFEHSVDGFEFEAPSQSVASATLSTDAPPHHDVSHHSADDLEGVGRSKLTLYIQMELCSTSTAPTPRADEPFDRFVDRLQQQPSASSPPLEQFANLAQWLRASVDARSARVAATHTEGLTLFLGVAQGVRHMHAVGVIHRDLKPDNVFLHGDVAKVGDFGLSKSIVGADSKHALRHARVSSRTTRRSSDSDDSDYGSDDSDSHDHTTALGTFTYASPEQLGHRSSSNSKATSRVKSAKYSVKSDIFALGVMLLELCCPFATMMERSQVLTAVRHGVVPQRALQEFPAEMALVLRMTAVDPAERPSADEICDQIRSLVTARTAISTRSALDDLRDLQSKFALAVHQLRDRSQSTLQLESLVTEMSDKLQLYSAALA